MISYAACMYIFVSREENTFFFQARVKVDPDGNGAHIYAYTYKILKGREAGQFLHDFLWYAIIIEDK